MSDKPTKGAERAARAILHLERSGAYQPNADTARLAGIIDRAIGLPALVTACEALLEFWDNDSPVHPGALVVDELRQALKDATGIAGARYPLPGAMGGEAFSRNEILALVWMRPGVNANKCMASVFNKDREGNHQCPRKPAELIGGYSFCKMHAPRIIRQATAARVASVAEDRVRALMEG